eukprot:403348162
MILNTTKTALSLSIIAFVISSSITNFAISKTVKKDYPVPEYKRGLTDHFITWLNDTGTYEPYGFNRTDSFGGSFGGKDSDDTPITKRPIIFIHGNSDMAIGDEWVNNGFRLSIEYFLSRGYTKAELYASQWGFADVPHEPGHVMQKEWVMQIRKFVEAVLEYTQAPYIDMISHSFGVTFSRRVIKGGLVFGDTHPYYIGEPLHKRVNTYIGIAGRNWGISSCIMSFYYDNYRICNKLNGGYPGSEDAQPYPKNMSLALLEMNVDPTKEAEHTYAIYSAYDASKMFSRYTQEWPTMDASYMFTTPEYDHVGTRDLSSEMQYNLVTYNSFVAPESIEEDGSTVQDKVFLQ